jgi:adenosine deaminase
MISPDLPLVDLHRHLEGSIRLSSVLELSRRHGLTAPAASLDELRRRVWITETHTDILEIMPRFDVLRGVLVDYDACRQVTWECIEDAARQGLDYVEVRFSPLFMAEPHDLQPLSVAAAVCEAWQEARRQLPILARLVVILSRTYGPQACEIELQAALAYRERGVAGLDLAGDEARHPAGQFALLFRRAREAGLRLTAHAGEFAGAESVRQTVLELGVERLGHAVRAIDDPAVLDLLAERGIAIECCPTSNVLTGSVPDYAEHPLPLFLQHGLRATLNTDDPSLMSEITLEHEYRAAQEHMGLDDQQLRLVQENGLQAAFLSDAERGEVRKIRQSKK